MTLCVASGCTLAMATEKLEGKIFDPQNGFTNASFFYENARKQEGSTVESTTLYKDRAGNVLVEEVTTYESGNLVRYTYNQKQVNETGEITVKDGKVTYKFRHAGKEDSESEKIDGEMIVPDMVPGVVTKHWDELMRGDTVKTRFLVLERQDNFGFKFFKDKERELNGVAVVDFILKPSSMFIAAVAPKIRITAEKAAPHRTVEMDGILPVRVPEKFPPRKRSDYHALDGLLRFELAK